MTEDEKQKERNRKIFVFQRQLLDLHRLFTEIILSLSDLLNDILDERDKE